MNLQWLLLLVLPSLSAAVDKICTRKLTAIGPELAVPGQATAVLVTLEDRSKPVNVTLRLVTNRPSEPQELLAQNTVTITGDGVVPLSVPTQASGECALETLLDCDAGEDSCNPETRSLLTLLGPIRDIIVRPKSKYYKPGETIEFWVLALDHDLHTANDVTGSVYIKDPTGTKVAIWEDVPLDDGVKRFQMKLSDAAAVGFWSIEAVSGAAYFSSAVNVSLVRGSSDPAAPELPIAEEHFVELRFSREMRRRYKPGLPFVGKVEAVSSEKAVRVRVKVLDNMTAIYSQDIEMSFGEGSFVVPAILSDSSLITLQAELVSVGGKEIDSHYVLARETIYKWNSTSSCYILVEGMENSLKPGEKARAAILSSCPCDRDLHYVITTEGHVTYWSDYKPSKESTLSEINIDGTSICRFNFTFGVEAVMAPVSHFLVYYVTDKGEPISDVITFDVKLLHKQVTVNLEHKPMWYPKDTIDVQILSELDSLVCLVGGRGGDSHFQKTIAGVEADFTEAGVTSHSQHCLMSNRMKPTSRKPRFHKSVMPESGLDQLWLWQCFNYTSEIEAKGMSIKAPDEPGKWTLWALAVSPIVGLRFSQPVTISVFRPVDVEFQMPPSLKVGESLEVDIKIGNNVNSCVDVNSLLSLHEGAHFMGSNQPVVAEKLRLGPHGATSLVVRVVPTTPGIKNMTVFVSAYHSDTCQSASSENSGNHSLVSTIVRRASVMVHPEGLVQTHTESAYFCANEQMVISTPDNFKFEFIPAPRNREGIVFEVRAGRGVHIALSDVANVSQKMYQVVIGDMDNSYSWIGRGEHGYSVHLQTGPTPQILSSDESRTFWLSWDRNVVAFGRGPAIHEHPTLKWRMDKMKINYLGFATTWGQEAEFRIWNYNDEAGFSQVLHLDIPRSVLPGSETGTLLVAGGLTLPYIAKTSKESLSEYSSLETAIASLAPLLVNGAEVFTNSSEEGSSLVKELGSNLQRLLLYRKLDGSFSNHHNSTSHWSSVTVLELLSKIQPLVTVDPDLLTGVKQWVQTRQQSDGSFLPTDIDVFVENSTGVNDYSKLIETTSDTLSALVNIGIETEVDSKIVNKARSFLEKAINQPIDGCTLSILCYALVSAKSEFTTEILDRLRNASTNEEGEFGWPRPHEDSDWLYEEGVETKAKPAPSSNLRDFKASLYALMTYTQLGDLKSAEPVARYLFYRSHILDSHTELVFTAVKAFSQFGWLALDQHRRLTVSLATSGMELTDTLELRSNSQPQLLALPSLPTKVFVYATGAGCATVQGRISYATYSPTRNNNLLEIWSGVTEEILSRRNVIQEFEGKLPRLKIRTCFRWKSPEPSGVLRLEVHLFSGFELLKVYPTTFDMDFGTREDRIWFVMSNVTSLCSTCVEYAIRSVFVVGQLRPALVRVYPSSRPDLAAEMFFHTQRGSPLLADTSDDDLITWFGKNANGDINETGSDFVDVCQCGKTCTETNIFKTFFTTTESTDDTRLGDDINDFTDIIVFSDLHENVSTGLEEFTMEFGLYNSTENVRSSSNYSPSSADFETTDDTTVELTTAEAVTTTEAPVLDHEDTDDTANLIDSDVNTQALIRQQHKKKAPFITKKVIKRVDEHVPLQVNQEVPVPVVQNNTQLFHRVKHSHLENSTLDVPTQQTPNITTPSHAAFDPQKPLIFVTLLDKLHTPEPKPKRPMDNDSLIIQRLQRSSSPVAKSVNQQLKPVAPQLAHDISPKPANETNPIANVIDSAEVLKENSEKLLVAHHEESLDILREAQPDASKTSRGG